MMSIKLYAIKKIKLQRLNLFLLFLLSLSTKTNFAQQTDSLKKIPPTQWTRTRKIDVKHIALDLSFDWQKKQAIGTATITLSPLNPTNTIALDAALLNIKSITTEKGTPIKYVYEGSEKDDNLKINLDRVHSPNEDLTIKITYNTTWINETDPNTLGGSNGKGLRFFQPTTTEPRKRQQIWSMSECESNRFWFPCHDVPNDFRTTELKATVDKKFTAISNGSLVETKNNTNGTRTFHWKMNTPYSNYQTSIVVGEYVEIVQNTEGVALNTFSYPDEVEATKASIVQLPQMLQYFKEKTGIKYPFSSYSQVFVQDLPWGMSNIGASTLTENMVDDYGTHADFYYLWDDLEGEALAHQWFGSYLTCNDWSQIWLNRSFSRYMSGLYDASVNGREEYLLFPHLWNYNTYFGDWNGGYKHPIVTKNYEDKTVFASDNYSVFRGALVLHTLRKHLGDDNWWKVIKHYVKTNAHKSVTTEDFRKAIEETTGEPMDWFFDQWIYKMGHPIFEVTKHYDATKKQLQLVVKQTQKLDSTSLYPQVTFFQGKIEIEMDGKIEQIWLEPKAENSYIFSCPQEPQIVGFDYENTWIKEVKFEKSLDELLFQFQNDTDILGRRGAMNELVKIAKKETTSATDKTKMYEAFRKVITSNVFWRFKLMALTQLQNILSTTQPVSIDKATTDMLLTVIKKEKTWVRNAAINCLGITNDPQYADLYISFLNDSSDRVVNAAAIALGKSKNSKAFDALVKLKDKPSWKNQSLISTLNGLKELKDPRGFDIALDALKDAKADARWTLAVATWDFRIAAAETLVALGKNTEGYPIVLNRFKKSIEENDLSDIFNNMLIITTLADPRGQEVFDQLKTKYKDDANVMNAVNQFEKQFKNNLN
jgi:aminopeptidase N